MIKYPWSLDAEPAPRRRRWWRILRQLPRLALATLLMLFALIVLYPFMVITVPSGQAGVLWKRFAGPGIYCWCILARGTAMDPVEIRDEGLHIIWPWDKLFIYDLRLQSTTGKYNAISSDGVGVTAGITFRYQLIHNSVAVLHKYIGPDYLSSLLAPAIGSQARTVIARYTAEQVYINRQGIENEIRDGAKKSLGAYLRQLFQPESSEEVTAPFYANLLGNSIQLLDTLVLSIELPADIVGAINRQAEEYYQIQEYKYRVEREVQESQRKQIEADGIAAFQRTVSQGISDSYLRWRGIEATLALAQSPNTKIVIIGNGKDGLPIILGNVESPSSSSPAQQPNNGATPPPGTAPAVPPATSERTPPDGSPIAPAGTPSASADRPPSSLPTLSDIEAIISRFSGVSRPPGAGTSTGTGANSK
jgi:regulator of protease activity HflC (stomatin/prohibitin superfamily)